MCILLFSAQLLVAREEWQYLPLKAGWSKLERTARSQVHCSG